MLLLLFNGLASGDTNDGFDEDSYRLVKEEHARSDKEFRSSRSRLREIIERAWDGPTEPVAAQVKEIATPYVERLESGGLRIDYAGLEKRNAAVMAELLTYQDALRTEYQRRVAIEQDDEDVMILTALWN